MRDIIELFIGGKWLPKGRRDTMPVINPATREVIAELCMADEQDLNDALIAAAGGFTVWRTTPAGERGRLLRETARLIRERTDSIARVLTKEQGKPLGQAKGELFVTAAYFDELADAGARIVGRLLPRESSGVTRSIIHEPIGPVFAMSPWNLPAMMPGRKIATTLAAGCSVIVKPAKETPQTAYLIARCCQDAGIPDGVVNVVSGVSSLISDTLLASPTIRKISFTGSTEVGKQLAKTAGAYMKKATMELGGHAPVIIFNDVDIDDIVRQTTPSRYANAGQSCMAATRFFVHDDVYEKFVESFARSASKLVVGNGLDDGTDMGPLTSERRLPVMQRLVDNAVRNGAALVTGGNRIDQTGFFFEPTVLSDLPDHADIMSEEPFGPITPIARFKQIDEVITKANSTSYGLAAYVFSRDIGKANQVAAMLDVGLVGINSMNVAGPSVPFGGVRDSGIGREGAMEGILESMTTKTISIGP